MNNDVMKDLGGGTRSKFLRFAGRKPWYGRNGQHFAGQGQNSKLSHLVKERMV